MSRVVDDVRFALRTLRKSPTFTAGAVLTIALGIGANVANFKTANAVLLRPNPGLTDPDRLVRLNEATAREPVASDVSYPNFRIYRRQARSFSGLAASAGTVAILGGEGTPRRLEVELVSDNYFTVLGIAFVQGRGFLPEEVARPGDSPVAVISFGLWERRFGRDPRILGRTVRINGREYAIIGVAPRGFRGFELFAATEAWLPVTMSREFAVGIAGTNLQEDPGRFMGVVGRLAPDVSRNQARAELQGIAAQLESADPGNNKSLSVLLSAGISMAASWRSDVTQMILAVSVLVTLLLLMVTANLTNLLLARATLREAEMAIRLSLGATRGAVIRQLLTESLILAAMGGVLAVGLAEWASGWTGALIGDVPFDLHTDSRVLAFAAAVALATGLLMGLLPALRSSRADLTESLKAKSLQRPAGSVARNALVVAQVSLAIGLLGVCGMLVQSLHNANRMDFGFPTHGLLLADIDLRSRGDAPAKARIFHERLLRSVRELPGVRSAALANSPPASTWLWTASVSSGGKHVSAGKHDVSPGYFRTVGIPILNGREFAAGDTEAGTPVAVVSQSLARYLWGSGDALGRTLELERGFGLPAQRVFVAGVAKDVLHSDVKTGPRPWIYLPLAQHHESQVHLHVAADDSGAMRDALAGAVRKLDPELPDIAVRNFDAILRDVFFEQRLMAWNSAVFGGIALLLSTCGVYALVAYSVSRRTREYGIRIAFGARAVDIAHLVLRQALRLIALAAPIGVAVCLAAGQVVKSYLVGVGAADITALAATLALIGAVSLLAAYLPARRATRVDPVEALRCE